MMYLLQEHASADHKINSLSKPVSSSVEGYRVCMYNYEYVCVHEAICESFDTFLSYNRRRGLCTPVLSFCLQFHTVFSSTTHNYPVRMRKG